MSQNKRGKILRVIVCGGRNFQDREFCFEKLDEIIGHEYTLIKSRLIKSGSRIIHKDDYLKGGLVVFRLRGRLLEMRLKSHIG